MKTFNDMVFGISDDNMGNYVRYGRTIKPLPYKKYIRELKSLLDRYPEDFVNTPYKRYAYITGRVKYSPLALFEKYLLLLDVDGVEEREQATKWLDEEGIRHFSVMSSPNHYWIICNKIDTVENQVRMMYEIPGVDIRYTKCSERQQVLLYRAFPKPGFIPQFDDISDFKGMGIYEKWILRFKEYWESKDIQEISRSIFLEAL